MSDEERLREQFQSTRLALESERRRRHATDSLLTALATIATATTVEELRAPLLQALDQAFPWDAAYWVVAGNANGHGNGNANGAANGAANGSKMGDELACVAASSADAPADVRWQSSELFERVWRGEPVALYDTSKTPDWMQQPPAVRERVRSAFYMPLVTPTEREAIVGVAAEPATFAAEHVRLAKRFCRLAVRGIATIELRTKLQAANEKLDEAIRAREPIIQVWDGVLAVPFFGRVDRHRAEKLTAELLATVAQHKARFLVIDLTAVTVADGETAHTLLKLTRAAKILGCQSFLAGLTPPVARALAQSATAVDVPCVPTLRHALQSIIAAKPLAKPLARR